MPLVYNSSEGATLKGHTFDADVPESLPGTLKGMTKEEQIIAAAELTARYTIVEKCAVCGEPLIVEEVLAHRMNHVAGAQRALVRTMMSIDKKERQSLLDVVGALTAEGF